MMTVLLVIIYVAFISLGLPDSLLGSAWPAMYEGFGMPVSAAGVISMTIAAGTIISSLLSERLIRRLGTGLVTLISVTMTAVALLGISFSGSFVAVLLWAIPLGLGAGSVDAALNNFVALHYKASHMNWLHCFWGLGASAGPVIMSYYLAQSGAWSSGYRAVSVIQFTLVAVLVVSLPLWKKARGGAEEGEQDQGERFGIGRLLALPGAKATLVSFFCYCAIETTVGLWGSTFFVLVRGIGPDVAARWISLYFMGITLGRAFSGFLSVRLSSIQMIRLGQGLMAAGVLILLLPLSGWPLLVGLFCIGLGCAPIFPTLLHETPNSFGKEHSQAIMGVQMATAYIGSTLMPPLFGLLGASLGYGLLPWYLGALLILMICMVQLLYRQVRKAA
ncbi:MFS transporter [Eubacteriales bacterium OttesenSCG-928-A19]|nr:MFS transporter [Eubacteriales bacterium OttesenSCG-928-A19]